jgi:nitroreductase
VVVVVASPVASPKVPEGEQILSAGAVCLAVLNAALASGWGANWLTGAMATDAAFLTEGLQIAAPDFIAGFIHIGSETSAPPDRPRPDIAVKVTWISA